MSRPITSIYRADHILGNIEELTTELYRSWGRTLGRLSRVNEGFAVGSDGRESSKMFLDALKEGLADVGVGVLDLGIVPHIATLFALLRDTTDGCAYVSGIGMPYTFNGLRWGLTKCPLSFPEVCETLREDAEQGFVPSEEQRCEVGRFYSFLQDWIDWHQETWFDTPKVPLHVIIDPLHGPWSRLARQALQVIFPYMVFEAIHDDLDPHYGGLIPNAHCAESIKQLCHEVDIRRADFGIVLAGETGRFSVCDDQGVPLSTNELFWLTLQSLADAISGEKVLHTITFPAVLLEEVRRLGGEPVLAPSSLMSFPYPMRQTNALVGFDHLGRCFARVCRGHYVSFFAVCWLLDFLARRRVRLSELRQTFPPCFATQELQTPWRELKDVAKLLQAKWNVKPAKTIDGIRFSGPHGHLNLREVRDYSQLAFQFEATNRQMLTQMIYECATAIEKTELDQSLLDAYRNDPICWRQPSPVS